MTTDETTLQVTPEERDASLLQTIGATWSDIAANHEMRCGACGRGTLTLAQVNATLTLWPPRKAITITLTCETCGMTFEMPYAAEEAMPEPPEAEERHSHDG